MRLREINLGTCMTYLILMAAFTCLYVYGRRFIFSRSGRRRNEERKDAVRKAKQYYLDKAKFEEELDQYRQANGAGHQHLDRG